MTIDQCMALDSQLNQGLLNPPGSDITIAIDPLKISTLLVQEPIQAQGYQELSVQPK